MTSNDFGTISVFRYCRVSICHFSTPSQSAICQLLKENELPRNWYTSLSHLRSTVMQKLLLSLPLPHPPIVLNCMTLITHLQNQTATTF